MIIMIKMVGVGKAISIPAVIAQITPDRIMAYFSLIRDVYGPATKAPMAKVNKPIERRPATNEVEYPNESRYKLKMA